MSSTATVRFEDPTHRGKIIKQILENHNMLILNNDDPTRLNPIHGLFSAIDLTFSSLSISHKLNEKCYLTYIIVIIFPFESSEFKITLLTPIQPLKGRILNPQT